MKILGYNSEILLERELNITNSQMNRGLRSESCNTSFVSVFSKIYLNPADVPISFGSHRHFRGMAEHVE